MECRPICRFLLLFLLLCILIEDVGVEMKIFEAYIFVCIQGRTMKLSIQVLQRYIILPKHSKPSLLLKPGFSKFDLFTHLFQGTIFNA